MKLNQREQTLVRIIGRKFWCLTEGETDQLIENLKGAISLNSYKGPWDSLLLRLPPELKEAIRRQAGKEGMNSFVIRILSDAVAEVAK